MMLRSEKELNLRLLEAIYPNTLQLGVRATVYVGAASGVFDMHFPLATRPLWHIIQSSPGRKYRTGKWLLMHFTYYKSETVCAFRLRIALVGPLEL